MDRKQVVSGLLGEYEEFAAMISELTPDEWRAATRCTGWEVRDIAGHVLGNVVDVTTGAIGTNTPEEQAKRSRDREPAEVAADLRAAVAEFRPLLESLGEAEWEGPSPIPDRTLGSGVLTLWFDAFVHADDVRAALGRPTAGGPGVEASVLWLCDTLERREWGPARLAFDGLGESAIGDGGPILRGDPMRFVLAASGRSDPAELGLDESVNVYS